MAALPAAAFSTNLNTIWSHKKGRDQIVPRKSWYCRTTLHELCQVEQKIKSELGWFTFLPCSTITILDFCHYARLAHPSTELNSKQRILHHITCYFFYSFETFDRKQGRGKEININMAKNLTKPKVSKFGKYIQKNV